MPYSSKDTATLIDAAYKAGFRGDALVRAVATAQAESSSFAAHNTKGEDSRGPWQINVAPNANPKYASLDLFDPYVAARAAFEISGGGKNFSPWTVWHSSNGSPASQYVKPLQAILGAGGAMPDPKDAQSQDETAAAVQAALASLSGGNGGAGLDLSSLLAPDQSANLITALDLLSYLRGSRTTAVPAQPSIADLVTRLYPTGTAYNPGMEPGGFLDSILGLAQRQTGQAFPVSDESRRMNQVNPKDVAGSAATTAEGQPGNLEATLLAQLSRLAQQAGVVPAIQPPKLEGAGLASQQPGATAAAAPSGLSMLDLITSGINNSFKPKLAGGI